ncbi:hypothetical protein ACFSQ3_09915 [Sphingobacterium corticis]|uniref:DUF4249 domain-containing protein n=1 Tax=Sphingobacterium corticis TaxID=1812823 RepID=A0ABW5NK96_9SPHI
MASNLKCKSFASKFMRTVFPLSILIGLSLQSCTKTEVIDFEQEPKNRITAFQIKNSPQPLVGAIDQDLNSIKLYIPYYSNLDFLIGEIIIDEGATLLRSDSTEINLLEDELDPIAAGDSARYIVRSADGKYRNYVLTQEILPHPDSLKVIGYGNNPRRNAFDFKLHTVEDGNYEINANAAFYAFGNFLSSSHRATFTLKNQETDETHTDYVRSISVSPQANEMYVMTARVSPNAKFGTYDVTLDHQGRTTQLAPMKIDYRLPYTESYSSSTKYMVGDTIVFESGEATFPVPEKIYLRVNKSTREGDVPTGFASNLYGKEIAMRIVSNDRSTIKAIFPEMPVGVYRNYQSNVINLYAVFKEEPGFRAGTVFGTEHRIAIPSSAGFLVEASTNN